MIQAKMANMYTTLNASRSYVYNVAHSLDRGERQNNVRHSQSINLNSKTTEYIYWFPHSLVYWKSLYSDYNPSDHFL